MMRKTLSLFILAGYVLVVGQSLQAQPTGLVLGHDFEAGAPGGIAADVSTWLPNTPAPLLGNAAVVASGDPVRGMVLSASTAAGTAGEHGEIAPHPPKLDKHNTWTYQIWFRGVGDATHPNVADGHGWQQLGGINGQGVRMFYIHGHEEENTAKPLAEGAAVLGAVWLSNWGTNGGGFLDSWDPVTIGIPDVDAFDPNAWHHLLMTFDGDKLYLYLDGQTDPDNGIKDRDGTQQSSAGIEAGPWHLGGQPVGAVFTNPGQVDDVAFFSGYAPPATVQGLFDGTYNLVTTPPPLVAEQRFTIECEAGAVPQDDLVAWWHFEEGPGATTTADLAASPATTGINQDAFVDFLDEPLMPDNLFNVVTSADTSRWRAGNVMCSPDADPNVPDNGNFASAVTAEGDKFESSELDFGFTLMAWIKPDNIMDDDTFRWFVSKGTFGPRIRYVNGGIGFDIDFVDQVTEEDVSFIQLGTRDVHGAIMNPGEWHHVAGVYDPWHPANFEPNNPATWGWGFFTKMELYIDGHRRGTLNGQKGPIVDTGDDPVFINNPGVSFDGKIDDVRLYKTALTQEQIRCAMFRCHGAAGLTDLNGNCIVNLEDLGLLSGGWQSIYGMVDLVNMSNEWLEQSGFPNY